MSINATFESSRISLKLDINDLIHVLSIKVVNSLSFKV